MKMIETIKIDRTELSSWALNIDDKVRSNLFNWNGQFSPQLIEALLSKYAKPGDTVFEIRLKEWIQDSAKKTGSCKENQCVEIKPII